MALLHTYKPMHRRPYRARGSGSVRYRRCGYMKYIGMAEEQRKRPAGGA